MTKATVLNTRAIGQTQETSEAFAKYGFKVLNFPCIEIASIANTNKVSLELDRVSKNDVIIFTSQYAVRYAFKINPQWQILNTSIVITVGTKTSQVLEQNYTGDIWIPQQQNSKGVIDLLKGINHVKSIKLITAAFGRTEIQKFAQERSINLQQINVYQRQLPLPEKAIVAMIENLNSLIILATSVTTLTNLQKLLPQSVFEQLKSQKLICSSNRIEITAKELGFNDTNNLNTANPQELAERYVDIL